MYLYINIASHKKAFYKDTKEGGRTFTLSDPEHIS